jgi:hypothetical protein
MNFLYKLFLQKPNPYGLKGLFFGHRIRFSRDIRLKHIRACSASDEIVSSYAQPARAIFC